MGLDILFCFQIIRSNSQRACASVLTKNGDTTTSYLLIQQAKSTDSGRYSCNPAHAASHKISVHVLYGKCDVHAIINLVFKIVKQIKKDEILRKILCNFTI